MAAWKTAGQWQEAEINPMARSRASASEVALVVNPRLGQPRSPKPSSGPPGPCWQCGAYGHLAAGCTASKPYPLSKCVVNSAEVSSAHTAQGSACANEVTAESATCNEGVDGSLAIDRARSTRLK